MVKIFYDGVNISKYAKLPIVQGFTTNTSFLRAADLLNIDSFVKGALDNVNGRSFSVQVTTSNPDKILAQAKILQSYGNNIFVKVPVIDEHGTHQTTVISKLLSLGIQVNITTMFTLAHIDVVADIAALFPSVPIIASIFAGRISDTGNDPLPLIKYACQRMIATPNVEVLWAGCKDAFAITTADNVGCHIITVPDAILDRINRIGRSLDDMARSTVIEFLQAGSHLRLEYSDYR